MSVFLWLSLLVIMLSILIGSCIAIVLCYQDENTGRKLSGRRDNEEEESSENDDDKSNDIEER